MSSATQEKPVWKQLIGLRILSPPLYWMVILLVGFELTMFFIAPAIVPSRFYLHFYLKDKSRDTIGVFLDKQGILYPDKYLGWINSPGYSKDNWQIDRNGSRSTHPTSFKKGKKRRVLFLGSSLINGGMHLKNNETVSYYIEDGNTEAINYGVMLYKIDQVLIYYEKYLYKYNPDYIVVGLNDTPEEGLENIFIPFFNRNEVYMPFNKPRFNYSNGTLKPIDVPLIEMLSTIQKDDRTLSFLEKNDAYFRNFEQFYRMQMSPILSIVSTLYNRGKEIYKRIYPHNDHSLLNALMKEFVFRAGKNNAEVLFVLYARESLVKRSGIERFCKDEYKNRMEYLRSKGYNVLDVRSLLRKTGGQTWEMYAPDGFHLSPTGNKLLAREIKDWINKNSLKMSNR